MGGLPNISGSIALQCLAVALGGAAGALLRFGTSVWLAPRPGAIPLATLAVNALGCLAIGAVMAGLVGRESDTTREMLRLGVGVGFLGALTTFSTFGYETMSLAQQGRPAAAAVNIALNLLLSLAAVTLGWTVTRGLISA